MAASKPDLFPENPANDYKPSRMEEQSAEQQALQLDFYQAMSDFRHMFPNMDEEIIEAVLRANNGAVDATIDQLLTMNVDLGEDSANGAVQPQKGKQGLKESKKLPEFGPDAYSTSSDDDDVGDFWSPPPYPPPSYLDYTQSSGATGDVIKRPTATRTQLVKTQRAAAGAADGTPGASLTDSPSKCSQGLQPPEFGAVVGMSSLDLRTPHKARNVIDDDHDLPPAPPAPLPPKMQLLDHKYVSGHSGLGPKKLYSGTRKWNPPILGDLPKDFLRLGVVSAPDCMVHGHRSLRHPLSVGPGQSLHRHSVGSGETSHLHSLGSSPSSYPHSAESGQSSPHDSAGSSPRVGSHRHPSLHQRSASEQLSSQVLQQRMAENQQERDQLQSTVGMANPERAQYLEDERLAICLQNEEFLRELRGDEDFMKTLQRDRMNATAFEPPKTPEIDSGRPRADQFEGYGEEDRHKSLGTFPFDQAVSSTDEDAEFRRQLHHMGGSSKKKFMALARNFFTRKKKKTSKQILKETAAPSTANLLDCDDSDDELLADSVEGSPFIPKPEGTSMKNSSSRRNTLPDDMAPVDIIAVPAYKTVQRPAYHPDTVVTYHGGSDEMV